MKLIKLYLDKISYQNKDNINIILDIKDCEIKTEDLTNININIFKLGEQRNEFVYGFGTLPKIEKGKFYITEKLSDSIKDGIYFIRHIKLIYSNIKNNKHHEISLLPKDDFELKFFHITHNKECDLISRTEIKLRIEKISIKRAEYRNKVIVTPKAINTDISKKFRVLIFGIGCLIHDIQELNGYTIYPIKIGLNYSNMNVLVNEFLSKHLKFSLPFNTKIDEEFKKSAPLFVIDYENVRAFDNNDAFQHCNEISQTIFSILANKNGQRPNLFAFVVLDYETTRYEYNFQFPGYQGNIISGFNPTETATEIDKLLPILSDNPWLKFVFDNHSFALNETNIDLKYFRLWAVLELIAKKEVSNNNFEIVDAENKPIKNRNGDNIKTTYTLAKVYYLVYHSNLTQATCSSLIPGSQYSFMFEMNKVIDCPKGTEKINLWDSLSAMYAIRNATAHNGKFVLEEAQNGDQKDKLAAKYYPIGFNMLLNQLESIVRQIIEMQIEKINNFTSQ